MNSHSSRHNPYAPPTESEADHREQIIRTDANIQSKCIRRGWTSISLSLSGDLEAELSYMTWTPGESVLLNGKLIARAKGLYITAVCPRIDFDLSVGDQTFPATVFARASYLQLLRLVTFRLVICDRVVYDSGG